MKHLFVVGNLGADAEKREQNGRAFVTFRVADTERLKDGTERVDWISCVMNGDGGRLLEFLKKGQKVAVSGRMSLRCFSSAKTHQWEAGVDLSVDRLELCSQRVSVDREAVVKWLSENPLSAGEILGSFQNRPL